ncbi:adenosylcobinamide-GDP ribazoletransferase [Lentibacillus saliphilus]|uniref:adenosylcobinamide-GDP ribazoletransferase n=1 Tax=Lentibacillus saliphilus TaxID=2737028 RepID=UPI001FE5549D|nr:adenosylcobinamide-GDP ribazoletransferase [Lentibacillus saliphilus]
MMKSYINGMILTLQFFSVIPINRNVPMTTTHIERAIRLFPVLGLLFGVLYGSMAFLLHDWTPLSPLAVTFFIWLFMIVITGGIHLDGWMDVGDAFFSYRDRAKRLEIMKDPRIGAFGVLSVNVLLTAKFVFIYETISMATNITWLLVAMIPFYGRMMMGLILVRVPAVKEEGLGNLFQQAARPSTLLSYLVMYGLLLLVLGLWDISALLSILIMGGITLLLFWWLKNRISVAFGGITGDVVGAAVEGTEVCLWLTVWLLHFGVTG